MSIIIKGVEMPKERSLWLCIKTDGTVYNIKPGGIGTAHAVGTAIPLPEGHGRLGDLDALKENLREVDFWNGSERVVSEQDINDAPTIIEAEGGEQNGRTE